MATRSKTAAKSEADEAAKKAAEDDAAKQAAGEEAAKAEAGGKVEVTALQTIRCDGKTYTAGRKVPVSQDHAAELVAAGVAER